MKRFIFCLIFATCLFLSMGVLCACDSDQPTKESEEKWQVTQEQFDQALDLSDCGYTATYTYAEGSTVSITVDGNALMVEENQNQRFFEKESAVQKWEYVYSEQDQRWSKVDLSTQNFTDYDSYLEIANPLKWVYSYGVNFNDCTYNSSKNRYETSIIEAQINLEFYFQDGMLLKVCSSLGDATTTTLYAYNKEVALPEWSPKEQIFVNGNRYNLSDDQTYSMTYAANGIAHVVIPSSIEGVPVTSIGKNTFKSMGIQSVTLPKTVTTIKRGAFMFCQSLKTINLENVITIEENAFNGCMVLGEINLSNVEVIGEQAFVSCYNIPSLYLPKVKLIYEKAFNLCGKLTQVTTGQDCIMIYADAFYDCTALTTFVLGSAVGEWYYYLVRTDATCDQIRGESYKGSVAGFGEKLESPTECATFLKSKHNSGVYVAQYSYFTDYLNYTFELDENGQHQTKVHS